MADPGVLKGFELMDSAESPYSALIELVTVEGKTNGPSKARRGC
ncbi:13246_t:CDS:2 [Ambispora gerdemannii]|uniref:13246_t:CDS:1 n=1 Tax=Ambispora gerdemannii TaxID=144530 RepID=A0A9N9ARZ9_9GLOM|nr:13246_t:CDS:2 [Ambispora gerdemannii]